MRYLQVNSIDVWKPLNHIVAWCRPSNIPFVATLSEASVLMMHDCQYPHLHIQMTISLLKYPFSPSPLITKQKGFHKCVSFWKRSFVLQNRIIAVNSCGFQCYFSYFCVWDDSIMYCCINKLHAQLSSLIEHAQNKVLIKHFYIWGDFF